MKIYQAGALFSDAEKHYNEYICKILEKAGYDVFLPQRDVEQGNPEAQGWAQRIYQADMMGLCKADVVVAVVDGAVVDDGTAWECGFASALDKPVILIRTDHRRLGPDEQFNLMIEQSANAVVPDIPGLIKALKAAENASSQA